jgi:predicted transcriptional regulator
MDTPLTPSISQEPTKKYTGVEERALNLLGQGVKPEQVAAAIGVTPSYISQLVSQPEFSSQVFELRYKNLSRHNERDNEYDSIEDKLLKRLKDLLPLMMKPVEVLRAIQVINSAKRRGASAPEQLTSQQTVTTLIMPVQIIQQFTRNSSNQVIKAGDQELITIQSGNMDKLLTAQTNIASHISTITPESLLSLKGNQNVPPSHS